jgi:hypothetical protein
MGKLGIMGLNLLSWLPSFEEGGYVPQMPLTETPPQNGSGVPPPPIPSADMDAGTKMYYHSGIYVDDKGRTIPSELAEEYKRIRQEQRLAQFELGSINMMVGDTLTLKPVSKNAIKVKQEEKPKLNRRFDFGDEE